MEPFDLSSLAKMAKAMQDKVSAVQAALAEQTVEGEAGGGMVKVVASGAREVVRVRIDPATVDLSDLGMLEDLIAAATNAALRKAADLAQREMQSVAAGLPLPPGLL